MPQTRIKQFTQSIRKGINTGFVSGLIVLFLILIGIPDQIEGLALFSLFLVVFVFGVRLARQLRNSSLNRLLRNTLAMGVVTALMVGLFLSLMNRWQANGIRYYVDGTVYLDAVTTDALSVLSGVPAEELHPHPPTDPITGHILEATYIDPATNQPASSEAPMIVPNDVLNELLSQIDLAKGKYTAEVLTPADLRYRIIVEPPPAGQTDVDVKTLKFKVELAERTNPMRLTLAPSSGLHLKLGFDLNLAVGGVYGFLLLLVVSGMLGGTIARGIMETDLGHYRKQAQASLSGNSLVHLGSLFLPLILFAVLWLSLGQGSRSPILSLGDRTQEIQLLLSFGIIICGLVAVRAAQPTDWNLDYPVRLGICLGIIALLVALGIWRIHDNKVYFIGASDKPNGSEILCILALIGGGILVAAQNVMALRRPGRFEMQFAGTASIVTLLIMPLFLDQYQDNVLMKVGIKVLLGLGLNIVVGYAGLLDLGYVAFFALGAYTYAFLSSNQVDMSTNLPRFGENDKLVVRIAGWGSITIVLTLLIVIGGLYLWRHRRIEQAATSSSRPTLIRLPERPTANITFGLIMMAIVVSVVASILLDSSGLYRDLFGKAPPFLIGLLVGLVFSGLSGILLGIPVLRLRGDYLAIVTLGFGEIIRLLFNNLRDYTGGPQGVLQIPQPLSAEATGPITYVAITYWIFLGAGLVAFLSYRLKQGRIGRAWNAMRSDEDIAQSMGINLVLTKLTAFAIGAAFAGIGGVLFAARQHNIFPNDFQLNVSIEVLSLVIIGGMGSIPGVIVGAIALVGIPEVLRELESYRILVFGALLVVMVIIRPAGLLPAPTAQLRDQAQTLARQFGPQGKKEGNA